MTAEDIRANHVRQMHDVGCTGESISRMLVNWSRPKRTWYESCHSLAHERVYTMIHHVGKCHTLFRPSHIRPRLPREMRPGLHDTLPSSLPMGTE